MFGGKRWCFTTCALFMLCLRSFHVTASRPNAPVLKLMSVHANIASPRWTSNLLVDKETSYKLVEAEPGFDFTDVEMKNLKIWPGGAIPYYIDEYSFDKVFRDRIRSFLDVINGLTGLNFLELPRPPGDDEARWVFFVNRQGLLSCVDHPLINFTSEGVQKVLLGYDCLSDSAALSEIILALVGVPPQHNAPNRNKYIEIAEKNIMPGKRHLFKILQDTEWLFHDVTYDFASASHYNLHKYTVNGQATIKPLKSNHIGHIGEAKGFSYTDIWKIRMLYNYMSKKRLKSLSNPECNKLFIPGANFDKYVPETQDDVQPRKKPNKYLGLPDKPKESENSYDEMSNETDASPPSIDNDVVLDEKKENENAEDVSVNEENAESKVDNPDELQEEVTENAEDVSVNEENTENKVDNPDKPQEEVTDKSDSENQTPPDRVNVLNDGVTDINPSAHTDNLNDDVDKPQVLKFVKPIKYG